MVWNRWCLDDLPDWLGKRADDAKNRKIAALEQKLQLKNGKRSSEHPPVPPPNGTRLALLSGRQVY